MNRFGITGLDTVIRNLYKINENLNKDTTEALTKGGERLRDDAINKLWEDSIWPMSQESMAIRDKNSWSFPEKTMDSVILKCNSPHALAVEFGTFGSSKLRGGKFHSIDLTNSGGPFPVGKNQYTNALHFAQAIKPQKPRWFLTNTIGDIKEADVIIYEISKVLKSSIMTVKG